MGRFYLLPLPLPLACLRANRKCSPHPTPPRALPHPFSWGSGACVHRRLRGLGKATPGSGRSKGQPLPRLFPASRRPRDREQASTGPPLSSAAAHFPLAVSKPRFSAPPNPALLLSPSLHLPPAPSHHSTRPPSSPPGPLYVLGGVRARPARDPAERGIVLSRDPGAYATERGVKMADEEAEQERLSRGGGGCAAELQRLGERLQELERQLRESRVPAVEAATEYCQQLCQVRAPGVPSPFPPARGGRGRASAWRPSGGRCCLGIVGAAARAGAASTRKAPLCGCRCGGCCLLGEGSCGQDGKSPLLFPSPNSGLRGPRDQEMQTGRSGALPAVGEGKRGIEARFASSSYCALGITAPRASAPLLLTPTGLRPHWFDSFASASLLSSVPPPGPVLAVSRPLLFEFRFRTEGAFVDVLRSSPRRPLLAGETFGGRGRRLSPPAFTC